MSGLKGRAMQDISFLIGGQAGDGVMRTAELLGKTLNRLGLYAFVINDYQSLIRGGHNFCKVRASGRRVWSNLEAVELIAALNQDTIACHENELTEGGRVLFDSDKASYEGPYKSHPIPLSGMIKEIEGIPIMRNSALIGAIAHLYGISLEPINEILTWAYGKRADKNIRLAKMGYDHAKQNFDPILKLKPIKRDSTLFISGAEAVSLGAVKAGMKVYIAYPMTPSTGLLSFMGTHQDQLKIAVIHPENEVGVANMALGVAYGGARCMVGTAGGGFALMQEAFSMAGQSEVPVVFVVGQRPAPAVGVPTYTAQADLRFVLHAGHGEFLRIVVAPGDPDEAFVNAGEAINLAWKYQVPAIILMDKHLIESYVSIPIDERKVTVEPSNVAESWEGEYKRYKFTDSGVSPMLFPGTPGAVIKVSSYEHNEYGHAIETPDNVTKMMQKRLRKMDGIIEDLKGRETVKIHGNPKAEKLVVAWGSTKGAVLEAMQLVDKPLKFLQIIYLSPFPDWEVTKHLEQARDIVCVEVNMTGQLRSLIREQTGHYIQKAILKNDGRPFDPVGLAEKLKEVFGWT
ncbi:MAG: pyruvate ferredoxin oxidoreductase [Hadesarchaea archaeon B3_Hades]|nr:MAG: pyruvate ferredoxin oxidoreductase [Hadesarchaea archaeon B3_Hades]